MGISDLILERTCHSCGARRTHLCDVCRSSVERNVVPQRLFAGSLPVHFAVRYETTARAIILAAKRTGARECIEVMARLARVALTDCLDELAVNGRICIIPMHSGAKTRTAAGQDLVVAVLRRALKGSRDLPVEVRVADVLQIRPNRLQQKLLNREQRMGNVNGGIRARAQARVKGVNVVIFDDVMTSGATLQAAEQAVTACGGLVRAGVVVAHRPWFSPDLGAGG
jgi:predicted amidophosphoribosyltransferase